MSAVRQGLKRLLMACLPAERLLVRGPSVPGRKGRAISLTFDDGPHPEYTPQVLDRLQQFGWKGTFFVVGERAERHPQLIRRIVDEGHELGNHSYTHSEPSRTSARALREEFRRTRALLKRLSGRDVTLTRPPKGELSWNKLRGLWQDRQTVVLWNVDPKDYRPGCDADLGRWASAYSPKLGDIVLLHDASAGVLTILDALQDRQRLLGVETVAVSAWLRAATGQPLRMAPVNRRSSISQEAPCP